MNLLELRIAQLQLELEKQSAKVRKLTVAKAPAWFFMCAKDLLGNREWQRYYRDWRESR
jgi:hypothetical protein